MTVAETIDSQMGPRARLADALTGAACEDHGAFGEVYALTSARLFSICHAICGDRAGAEDVLHEVYVAVWRRAGSWNPAYGTAMTWLTAIARNRSIDWLRANGRHRAVEIDEAFQVADPAPSAEALLLSDEANRHLHRCLDALDECKRDAIRAAFFQGLTYAELAENRGVPLGTMKSWIKRGLAEMNRSMQPSNDT